MSDGTPAGIAANASALAGRGGALLPAGHRSEISNSGLGRLTLQMNPRNKLSGYFDRIHKDRAAAMGPGDDQRIIGGLELAALHDRLGEVHVDGHAASCSRGRLLEQPRALQQPVPARASSSRFGTPASGRWRARRLRRAGTTQRASGSGVRQLSGSLQLAGFGVVRHRLPQLQSRVPGFLGPLQPDRYANASLYQNYTQVAGVEDAPDGDVTTLPARWEDSLSANLGIYAQDVWTMNATHE